MKCIFCRQDSTNSKSVEHIVPNSFGNTTAILKKGIVCDKCNNYFARKVEQPFLEAKPVRILRQELEIENKRGKLITEYSYPRVGKEYVKQISYNKYLICVIDDNTQEELSKKVDEYQRYMLDNDKFFLEQNYDISRLLAKMAVEFFVYNSGSSEEVCEDISTDKAFQSIRHYARYGSQKIWKYNARRIYARNEVYQGKLFTSINWEADWLFLKTGEIYFVIAMFGIEYAICINSPTIDGYQNWLIENKGMSPLYAPKKVLDESYNAFCDTTFNKQRIM